MPLERNDVNVALGKQKREIVISIQSERQDTVQRIKVG